MTTPVEKLDALLPTEMADRVDAFADAVEDRFGGIRVTFNHGGVGKDGGSLSVKEVCDMLAKLLRTPTNAGSGVKVRKLDWRDPRGDGSRWAKDPYGGWVVATENGWGNRNYPEQVKGAGLDANMAAAEANHQAIILSAIEAHPITGVTDADVLRAAKAILYCRFGSDADAFFEPVPDDFPQAAEARANFARRVSEAMDEGRAALSGSIGNG